MHTPYERTVQEGTQTHTQYYACSMSLILHAVPRDAPADTDEEP